MAEILITTFSHDIPREFGLDKCALTQFVNDQLSEGKTGAKVRRKETIKGLKPGKIYNYLCVDESNRIQHSSMRERLRLEYSYRVNIVLLTRVVRSEQGCTQQRVGTSVLKYSFDAIH